MNCGEFTRSWIVGQQQPNQRGFGDEGIVKFVGDHDYDSNDSRCGSLANAQLDTNDEEVTDARKHLECLGWTKELISRRSDK